MSSVNKIILLGRVGVQPETRQLDNGTKVANFTMATSEIWKDKNTGEKKEDTTWHKINVWRGLAEVVEKFVNKGDMVYIEGKIKTRSYEKEGVTHYVTEVTADNLTMLGGNNNSNDIQGATERKETPEKPKNEPGDGVEMDDLPF